MRKGSKVGRPLSSAANFFKRNGASDKGTDNPAVPVRAARSSTRVLECQPDERELLGTSILPAIINYLGENALHLDDLFRKDPSAATQDAMMGLVSPGQKESVRALRELLDARYSGDESSVFSAHDPYVWAISLKDALKELSRPLVPSKVAISLVDAKDHDSVSGKAEYFKRMFVPECPEVVQNLFLLLSVCLTEKSKLGYMFSALIFLSVQSGQDEADYARLSANVQALSDSTSFLVTNAEMVFGPSPWQAKAPKPKATAPPPPPPNRPQQYESFEYEEANNGSATTPTGYDGGGYETAYSSSPATPSSSSANLPPASSVYPGASDSMLFKAICVYDFDPVQPDELTLRIGDVIAVHYVGPDDWYWGRVTLPEGVIEEGVFPAVYVRKEEPPPGQQKPPAPSPMASKQSAPPPPPPPPPAGKVAVVAAPVFRPEFQDDDDMMSSQMEKASLNAFSSSGAPPPPPPVVVAANPSASLGANLPLKTPEGLPAVALFDFVPEESGELALTKGEALLVLDRSDPEWWLAKRTRDGVQGLFPYNYAKLSENAAPAPAAQRAPAPLPAPVKAPTLPPAPLPPVQQQQPVGAASQSGGAGRGSLQRASSSRGGARPPPPPPPSASGVAVPPAPQQQATRQPAPLPPPAAAAAGRAPAPLPPAPGAVSAFGGGGAPPAPTPITVVGAPPSDVNPVAMGWNVTPEMLSKYQNFFMQRQKDPFGRVAGRECATFLQDSGLDRPVVAHILELSDIDRDGAFDSDEFALAMHLALCVSRRSMPLYSKLPRYLIPPSKQHLVPPM